MVNSIGRHAFLAKAQQIVAVGQWLARQGWAPATGTNFSMRIDDKSCAITMSGKDKGALLTEDIMQVDLTGEPMTQGKPSAETLLHTQLYQLDSDTNVVLHTHSVHATVLSKHYAHLGELHFSDYEMLKAFPGIDSHQSQWVLPIFDNTQDMPVLAHQLEQYLHQHPQCCAYLIAGHGAYTWGRSMDECKRHVEALEFLLQCYVLEQSLRAL